MSPTSVSAIGLMLSGAEEFPVASIITRFRSTLLPRFILTFRPKPSGVLGDLLDIRCTSPTVSGDRLIPSAVEVARFGPPVGPILR